MIRFLCWLKVDAIAMKLQYVSQALIDMEISREEFSEISREKKKYEMMKENVRNVSEKQENVRLNSVNSKKN